MNNYNEEKNELIDVLGNVENMNDEQLQELAAKIVNDIKNNCNCINSVIFDKTTGTTIDLGTMIKSMPEDKAIQSLTELLKKTKCKVACVSKDIIDGIISNDSISIDKKMEILSDIVDNDEDVAFSKAGTIMTCFIDDIVETLHFSKSTLDYNIKYRDIISALSIAVTGSCCINKTGMGDLSEGTPHSISTALNTIADDIEKTLNDNLWTDKVSNEMKLLALLTLCQRFDGDFADAHSINDFFGLDNELKDYNLKEESEK